jgi:hypothetical protein
MTPLTALLLLGLLLGAVDTAQTVAYTGQGYYEANPLWRTASPAAVVTVKTGLDVGMAVGLHKVGKRHRKAAIVGAVALVLIRGVVVARNYRVVR